MPTTVHPLTQQSVSYILTMVDRATCYTVLCPVADTTAKSTAFAILHNWIPHYGLPIWVNTDLGPAYTSKVFHELCLLLGITHIFAASQNHKFVARAEVTHRTILTALRKVCAQSTDWVSKLPGIVLSINTSVLTTVGLTPAALLFHRDIWTPFLAQLAIRPQTSDITLSELVDTVGQTDPLLDETHRSHFSRQINAIAIKQQLQPTQWVTEFCCMTSMYRAAKWESYISFIGQLLLSNVYRIGVTDCVRKRQDVFFLLKFMPLV